MTPNLKQIAADLKAQDVAMRDAWRAFVDAVKARRDTARSVGADPGEIRLDNGWGEDALIGQLTSRIQRLPSGEALDFAIGRAILAQQERAAHAAKLAEERAEAERKFEAAKDRVLADLNRRPGRESGERARALAALEASE